MSRNLVICLDGTSNEPETGMTNVARMYDVAEISDAQLVYYDPGVGTMGARGAVTPWGRRLTRVVGLVSGFGIKDNLEESYGWLMEHYRRDDRIYVFGFSRGAYTARSLAGMIGRIGLLKGEALVDGKLGEACERYQLRATPKPSWSSPEEFKAEFCHESVPIKFLGVFDTVGALGVPGAVRRRHQFHDVRLGPAVTTARQALAIDEPRMKFEPCLWEQPVPAWDPRRIKQVWFEGCHSDVGGGYRSAEAGLSNTAWLGHALYTDYLLPFEVAALILTVGVVAAVALTLRHRGGTRYQSAAEQVAVKASDRVRIVKMAADTNYGRPTPDAPAAEEESK